MVILGVLGLVFVLYAVLGCTLLAHGVLEVGSAPAVPRAQDEGPEASVEKREPDWQ